MNSTDSDKSVSSELSPDRQFEIEEFSGKRRLRRSDTVVVEEPVEIRIVCGPVEKRFMRSVSITMRTPGADLELAAGFLFSENILTSPDQIAQIQTGGTDPDGQPTGNIVRVDVKPDVEIELGRLQRHFFTTSSCGVCGKASLEALEIHGLKNIDNDGFQISSSKIRRLPELLRARQATFRRTGGLHASGLANSNGELIDLREDVGRHNAVDKLVGRYFLDGKTPLAKYVMIVSGRVSFEIMQKALVAGIPMIVAVGAPSSLAIEMADQYRMTLIGFASSERFNVYSAAERVKFEPDI